MTTRTGITGSRKGVEFIEFTFVAIPMMLLLVSTIELARGMWTYNTLAHAIRDATRYVIVHGNNCTAPPNYCAVRIQDIAQRIRVSGVGLDPDLLYIQFIAPGGRTIPTAGWVTLKDSLSNATYWPTNAPCYPPPVPPATCPDEDPSGVRTADLEIQARYQFVSAMYFFWPGAVSQKLGSFWLAATSKEMIQF
jgi:Flp pilus assembly protein TadG